MVVAWELQVAVVAAVAEEVVVVVVVEADLLAALRILQAKTKRYTCKRSIFATQLHQYRQLRNKQLGLGEKKKQLKKTHHAFQSPIFQNWFILSGF